MIMPGLFLSNTGSLSFEDDERGSIGVEGENIGGGTARAMTKYASVLSGSGLQSGVTIVPNALMNQFVALTQ